MEMKASLEGCSYDKGQQLQQLIESNKEVFKSLGEYHPSERFNTKFSCCWSHHYLTLGFLGGPSLKHMK